MVTKSIRQFLIEIGIPTNLCGFDFLECAIIECIELGGCKNVASLIYPRVAEKKGVTAAQVERNIRNSIEQAYNRGKLVRLNRIFNTTLCSKSIRPTNKEVMSLGMLYVRQKLADGEMAKQKGASAFG